MIDEDANVLTHVLSKPMTLEQISVQISAEGDGVIDNEKEKFEKT